MRAALPWITSLILHSTLVIGVLFLSRVPVQLPKSLNIDFQLTPSVASEKAKAPFPQVKEIQRPVEKHLQAVKPAPSPIPEKKEIEPIAKITPAPPVLEKEEIRPPSPIAHSPPEKIPTEEPRSDPPTTVEKPVNQKPSTTVSDMDKTQVPPVDPMIAIHAAKEAQYLQTISVVRGQVLNRLTYPAAARRMGWCGKLVLGFTLCSDGSVEGLEIVKSSGYKLLDRAAMKAVRANAPFRGNFPKTQVRLPINFQLN